MKITDELKKVILTASQKMDLDLEIDDIKIEHPSDINFGDYSTNIAMSLAKQKKINPKELAESLRSQISELKNYILTPNFSGLLYIYFKSLVISSFIL